MPRAALGFLLGLLARLWLATLRVTYLQHPAPSDPRPWVLVFFHGQQFALLGWPRRRSTGVLVSLSRDGDIQARALPRLGLVVRRGSSSRGGARGLAALIRLLRGGMDAAFAVDGPRGPRGHVSPGALAAALHARGALIPLACASDRPWVLRRAWDQFELPRPFSRVVVVIGPAVTVASGQDTEAVRRAIEACAEQAAAALRGRPALEAGLR